ncbi:Transcription regulatory protein SNF5 [Cavenderia fasciculata]|uniref:Transcription regulatory protein SNF5 n=1 Tax=Cavenderia fasciculata TaxID=261658 RepID=F4Q6P6_CACFS|nr:Transcription regulatory protein SNF5 [Cavenderia fasciculata]EGG16556.1 Transcription regulatory protein SNF5 [Cavenderia fasciculata]|eukprot:XP_004354956.1 Transcription regulatory protein SNF5 [Cavenderia fasciculata]
MNSFPSQNESPFSYAGNLNGNDSQDPYGDISSSSLHQAVPFDNDSLLQHSALYLENILEHTDDNYLHESCNEHDLIDPQWDEKETMTLIELAGTVGFNWNEISKRMNKNPEDCQKRYELVIKVFESKPNLSRSSGNSIETSLSSSSSPVQSPTINSSVPSPDTDNTSSDDKFDGSRRRKSTSTVMDHNLKKRHRRTASEIDRSYKCFAPSCSKSYGTEGALKMHFKLKHPGVKIPQVGFSPTLHGQFYHQPRMISPYNASPYLCPTDIQKELVYNAQAGGNNQNPFLPHSYPQLPTFPKQRVILPNTSLSAPSIPINSNPNLQPLAPGSSTSSFSPSSSSSDLQSSLEPFMTTPVLVNSNSSNSNSSPPSASQQVYRFSDLPSISLKIGGWQKQSQFCGDLVARFSYTEHKFMWEIYNHGESLTKMEIFFDDLCGMEFAPYADDRIDVSFLLKKPPQFYEAKFGPNQQASSSNMTYKSTSDFTGGEALQCKKHTLCFIKNALSKPLEALCITDPKLKSFIEASNLDISTFTPLNNNQNQISTNNNIQFNNNNNNFVNTQSNNGQINNNNNNGNPVYLNPSLYNNNNNFINQQQQQQQQQPQQATIASTATVIINQQQTSDSSTPLCTEPLSLQQQQQQQTTSQQQLSTHDYLASSHQNISIPLQQLQQQILTNSPSLNKSSNLLAPYNSSIPQHSLNNNVPSACLDLLPEQPGDNNNFNNNIANFNPTGGCTPNTPLFSSTELTKRLNDNLALCSPLISGQSIHQLQQQHQQQQQSLQQPQNNINCTNMMNNNNNIDFEKVCDDMKRIEELVDKWKSEHFDVLRRNHISHITNMRRLEENITHLNRDEQFLKQNDQHSKQIIEKQQTQIQSYIDEIEILKQKEMHLPPNSNQLRQMLDTETNDKLVLENRSNQLQSTNQVQLDNLSSHTTYFRKYLSLDIEIAKDGIKFIFTNIDKMDHTRKFQITLTFDENDEYKVLECSPMINDLDTQLEHLNMIKSSVKGLATCLLASKPAMTQTRNIGSIIHSSRTHSSGLVATIFGVTGFTGRYLVQMMTKSGIQVVVPYRGEDYSFRDLKVLGELGQVIPVRYDIRNEESIERAISHSNIVINLAGRFWPTRNYTLPDINIDAAERIARLSNKMGNIERFVHVSALGVSEDHKSEYARTKAVGEKIVRDLIPSATIVRPSLMFGDEDRLINKWSKAIQWAPFVPRYNEDLKFQPLHCVDFAKAIMSILELQTTHGKVYELGGDEIFTWGQFLDMVIEATAATEKRNIPVSVEFMKMAAEVLQYARDPLFLPDEIEYHNQDLLVGQDALGLKDLRVKPTPIQEKLIRLSRMYRPSKFFNAIANPQMK